MIVVFDSNDLDYDFVAVDDFHVNADADADENANEMNLVVLKCTVGYLNWFGGADDGGDANAGVALARV